MLHARGKNRLRRDIFIDKKIQSSDADWILSKTGKIQEFGTR